ncbi:MAG: hypothetical protein WBR17_32635 [Paraburkholderia sp.]
MMRIARMMGEMASVSRCSNNVHIVTVNRPGHMFILRRRHFAHEMRSLAFHGESRERLNRKAQHQQHDDEEFAPI